jgi:hypothetical protein
MGEGGILINIETIEGNAKVSKLNNYNGQIPEYFTPVLARNEQEAMTIFIKDLRNKFNSMTDEEIENEFGLLVYK